MMKSSRLLVAARLRQYASLLAGGASHQLALDTAVADNPRFFGVLAERGVAPDSVEKLIPEFFSKTRAMVASSTDAIAMSRRTQAVANVLDAPTARGMESVKSIMGASIFVAVFMVTIISVFVIPAFTNLFESFGTNLPMPTTIAISVTQWIIAPFAALLALLGILLAVWNRRPEILGRLGAKLELLVTVLPLISQYARTADTHMLAAWLSETGFEGDLAERLDCLAELAGSGRYARKVHRLAASIRGGKTLRESVIAGSWLPGIRYLLEDASAESNEDMQRIFAAYTKSLDDGAYGSGLQTGLLTIVNFVMGIFIGFLVISLYLPIFKMGSMV